MSCEPKRPCQRCIDRGIAHLCRDHVSKKKRGRKGTYLNDNVSNDLIPTIPSSENTIETNIIIHNNNINSNNDSVVTTTTDTVTSTNSSNYGIEDLPTDIRGLLADFFFSSLDEIDKYMSSFTNSNNINSFDTSLINNINMISNNNNNNAPSGDEEMLNKFISMIQNRASDEEQFLIEGMVQIRESVSRTMTDKFKISNFNSVQNLESLKTEIERLVQNYSKIFHTLAIPTILFDRTGVIYYVNNAYKALTGLNVNLPTDRSEFAFYVCSTSLCFNSFFKIFIISF